MPQQVEWNILANVRGEREVRKLADASDMAAAGAKLLREGLEKQRKAADASIGATLALARADKTLRDAEFELSGEAAAADLALRRQGDAAKDTARKTEASGVKARLAAAGFGDLGGAGGMGAVIGAGIALSPVIATTTVGLGGLAAAAYGTVSPVLKAAGSGKEAVKAFRSLDPAQRQALGSLRTLKGEYHSFQKSLEPQVIAGFGQAVKIAGHLMKDVQPIAAATGTALDSVLGRVDAEFRSRQWQGFFTFMRQNAGPDIQQLGSLIVDLTSDLPPLLEALQPVAHEFLVLADNAAKAIGPAARGLAYLSGSWQKNQSEMEGFNKRIGEFMAGTLHIPRRLIDWTGDLQDNTAAQRGAAAAIGGTAGAAKRANPFLSTLAADVKAVTGQLTLMSSGLLTSQGDLLSWKQAVADANKTLKANSHTLDLHTQAGRDDRQAILAATSAAVSFASQQVSSGHDIKGASKTIQDQIGWLQGLHSKSAFVKDEIAALRREETRLRAELDKLRREKAITEIIRVTGTGSWAQTSGILPGQPGKHFSGKFAFGGLIPGFGDRDTVPAMLTPGEAVVPKHLVPEMAPWARMRGIPGFAAGGIVPRYRDGIGAPFREWIGANVAAAQREVITGIAGAMAKQASALFAGGAGMASSGLVRTEQSYAASLFGRYGWGPGQLPPLIALWNRESGWNPWAVNRSSGAYGIPQALGHGHPFDLGDWPAQIGWGEGYIAGRYGSPAGAWSHEQAVGWYGRGGLVRGYAGGGGLVAPGARTWSAGAVPATERAPVSLPGSSLARMQAAAHAALSLLQGREAADYAGLRHAFRVSLLGSEHTPKWLRAHKHGAAAEWAASHPAARAWLALPRHRRWVTADLEHLARLQERETAAFKAIAGGDVTFVNLAALARAVGLESAGLRGMGALSHVPGGHPGWAGGLTWWLRGLGAAAGTARAALGAQFHVYDSGGWLPPGASVAVNRTGHPEMVVPASRGAPVVNNFNINVTTPVGSHPAEIGRVIVQYVNEYLRRGNHISNGRGKVWP